MLYLLETYEHDKDLTYLYNRIKLLDTKTRTVSYYTKEDVAEKLLNGEQIQGIHIYKNNQDKVTIKSRKFKGLKTAPFSKQVNKGSKLGIDFDYQLIYESAVVYTKYYIIDGILLITYTRDTNDYVFEVWLTENEDAPVDKLVVGRTSNQGNYSLETYGAYKVDDKIYIAMTDAIAWYDIKNKGITMIPSDNEACIYNICNVMWYGDCTTKNIALNIDGVEYILIESKSTKKQYIVKGDKHFVYSKNCVKEQLGYDRYTNEDNYITSLVRTATLLVPKYNLFQKIQELGIKYIELLLSQLTEIKRLNPALAKGYNLLPELTYIVSYLVTQDLQIELQELEDKLGIYRIYVDYVSGFEDDYINYNIETGTTESINEKGKKITCRLLMAPIYQFGRLSELQYSYELLIETPFIYTIK